MALSCGNKTDLPCASTNWHYDPQISGRQIQIQIWVSGRQIHFAQLIGCHVTNLPYCVTHQKAVFCGKSG